MEVRPITPSDPLQYQANPLHYQIAKALYHSAMEDKAPTKLSKDYHCRCRWYHTDKVRAMTGAKWEIDIHCPDTYDIAATIWFFETYPLKEKKEKKGKDKSIHSVPRKHRSSTRHGSSGAPLQGGSVLQGVGEDEALRGEGVRGRYFDGL